MFQIWICGAHGPVGPQWMWASHCDSWQGCRLRARPTKRHNFAKFQPIWHQCHTLAFAIQLCQVYSHIVGSLQFSLMDVACTKSICIIWFFTRVAFLSAVQCCQVTFVKLLGSVFSSFPLLRHFQEWNGRQGYNLWQIWTSSGTSALYFPPIPSLEPSSTHTRETRTNK